MTGNGYIDIPNRKSRGRYPWDEWEKIPPGKGLDITEHVAHLDRAHWYNVLTPTARKHGLRYMTLKGTAIIYREAQP